jgi:GNAT superfamily N-acetyltransferase
MWGSAPVDALYECGIAERRFGPVQANVIEVLPDAPTLNTILGAAEHGAVKEGHLAEALEWADAFRVDYRVMVGHDRPETDAAEALLDRTGFEQGQRHVRYARNAMLPPEQSGVPGVKVWEIGEPGDEAIAGETMALTAAPALGMPASAGSMLFDLPALDRWRCYTAELEEEIVSFGSMLIDDGVAVIGLEGTVENARGRGCNQALLRARILAAREAGCETIFAGIPAYAGAAAGPSTRNLIRAGFVPAHRSVNWQRPR